MRRLLIALVVALSLAGSAEAAKTHATTTHTHRATHAKRAKANVPRTAKGRIQRSAAARHAFARQTGYPHGRKGWVVDHIIPLACGGADAPSNMRWQLAADAKAKDKWERKGC